MNIMKLKFKKDKKLYLAIALVAGILLVMSSGMFAPKKETVSDDTSQIDLPDSDDVEKRLKAIIETVDGISDVSVFVTYDNMGKKKIATTAQESISADGDKRNSSSKTEAVTTKGSSGEEPFVREETLPEVRGVIICAKGVGNEEMKLLISDAVSAAMGVPAHRVKVLSKD